MKTNIDNFFLIINGSLIILMQVRVSTGVHCLNPVSAVLQAGFGFLEAGSVRSKNVTNILIKNFTDLCLGQSIETDFGSLRYCL